MARESAQGTARHSIFDRSYEILSTIGHGQNSVVYKALAYNLPHLPPSQQVIALKVLTGSSKHPEINVSRMEREALAMLSSRHQNVIKINDFVAKGELCYLCMEYADVGDLAIILEKRTAPFEPEFALRLIIHLLRGLHAVHRVGIIHCDIKPENLLLTSSGALKLADFSVAILPFSRGDLVEKNLKGGIGTLDYLAPETLAHGEQTHLSDIYAVGVTCYQLLTRHLPFEGNTFTEQIENKMNGNCLPLGRYLENAPLYLDELLSIALASQPEKRFQSASDFRQAIESFLDGTWAPFTSTRSHFSSHSKPFSEEMLSEDLAEEQEHPEKQALFLKKAKSILCLDRFRKWKNKSRIVIFFGISLFLALTGAFLGGKENEVHGSSRKTPSTIVQQHPSSSDISEEHSVSLNYEETFKAHHVVLNPILGLTSVLIVPNTESLLEVKTLRVHLALDGIFLTLPLRYNEKYDSYVVGFPTPQENLRYQFHVVLPTGEESLSSVYATTASHCENQIQMLLKESDAPSKRKEVLGKAYRLGRESDIYTFILRVVPTFLKEVRIREVQPQPQALGQRISFTGHQLESADQPVDSPIAECLKNKDLTIYSKLLSSPDEDAVAFLKVRQTKHISLEEQAREVLSSEVIKKLNNLEEEVLGVSPDLIPLSPNTAPQELALRISALHASLATH